MIRTWKVCAVLCGAILLACPLVAKKKEVIERYEATAMSLEAGRANRMEIGIFGWTSDEERTALANTFKEGGGDALYKALGKNDEMAFVSIPTSLGYQMRYAFQSESDGKRVIALATDRPIAMGEVLSGSMSQRDNVSIVLLALDPSTGEGTGEMIVGAGFSINDKTGQLEIETVGRDPIKFTSVKPIEKKHKN